MMRVSSRKLWLAAVAVIGLSLLVFALNFNVGSLISSQQKKNDELIAEQMAYHVGTLAYLYGYPIVDMHK